KLSPKLKKVQVDMFSVVMSVLGNTIPKTKDIKLLKNVLYVAKNLKQLKREKKNILHVQMNVKVNGSQNTEQVIMLRTIVVVANIKLACIVIKHIKLLLHINIKIGNSVKRIVRLIIGKRTLFIMKVLK